MHAHTHLPTSDALIERLLRAELKAPSPATLRLADAQQIAASAEKTARAMGLPVVISIADAQGEEILFHRMEGSLPASARLATDKAWTAAAFRMSTEELGRLAQPGQMLFGLEANHGGRVVIFGGGLACWRNGTVIGAIGISGGTADEDAVIARYALSDFSDKSGQAPVKGAEK
ncbi:heme-binding protein [Breoghania sp. JC706]|uniref:GlcG/HbpS family heme-binding protein n=1 Tax=Breoghania sp. JC706 TaxID=3117732 RepID=UPI00300B92FC